MNLERAKDLKNNPVWGEIREELDKKIHFLGQELHTAPMDKVALIQNEIKVYKQVRNLPEEIERREEAP